MRSNNPWLYMQLLISTVCGIYGYVFASIGFLWIAVSLAITPHLFYNTNHLKDLNQFKNECRQEKLLFSTDYDQIKEIDMDSGIEKVLINLRTTAVSITYDVKGRYVYASSYDDKSIVRFPYLNDQLVTSKIVVTANRPYSLAFDSGNSHLYWTEYTYDGRIMRCNSDGSDVTTIVTASDPIALTLDTHNRWIYYSEGRGLHRVTFDGLENQVVVNLTARPIGIEIDFVDQRVYWMELETGDLKSALYNGSDVKTVVSTNVKHNNREIGIGDDYVFFTSYNKILKIHKSLGQLPAVVYTGPIQIYGLIFYKEGACWGVMCEVNKSTRPWRYQQVTKQNIKQNNILTTYKMKYRS